MGMPATKAVNPRATLTFEYLCDVLLRAKLITQDQWRDALGKGDVVARTAVAPARGRGAQEVPRSG